MPYVLILFYSRSGSVAAMAKQIARGVGSINGMEARLRTVPSVSANHEATDEEIPDNGAPYASLDDLKHCSGLIMGSPTRFGNMAAPLKYFLDNTSTLWASGDLVNKPAGVFTSSSTAHGGQESTLLSMQIPLQHHGMLICGLPFTLGPMHNNLEGGGPYGAGHINNANSSTLTKNEKELCNALGKRIATLSLALSTSDMLNES